MPTLRVSARLGQILLALQSRNYRLFFAGQGISLLGTCLQQIALGWFVYSLTGSKILLGALGFLQQAPGLVILPIAGAISDRIDRRRALIVIQCAFMVQALALALAVATGHGTVPILLTLSAVQGILNAFELPIRQSAMPELVQSHAELPSAIALNAAQFNVMRILGPTAGGILLSSFGVGTCFVANAASYLAVLYALIAMSPFRPKDGRSLRGKMTSDIAESIRYLRKHRPIRDLLMLLAAEGFLGLSYIVVFPVLASEVLHGDPHTLGFLMGAAGVGSLLAALRLASRPNLRGLLGSIAFCLTLSSIALMLFVFAHSLVAMMVLIATAGFGFISVSGACNTIVQTLVENSLRGRVLSFYSLAFFGTTSFGSLALGWLSQQWGVARAIALFGSLLLLCALTFYVRLGSLRAAARPVYVEHGLIPWEN